MSESKIENTTVTASTGRMETRPFQPADRQLLQIVKGVDATWQIHFLDGPHKRRSSVSRAGLERLVDRKRNNLDRLYEPGSDRYHLQKYELEDLEWQLEQIVAAEAEETA